jgi:dolichyl-phosphate beta-glucosyltransferase
MKGFHLLVMILCTKNIEDTQCGFKLFTNDVAKTVFANLHLNRWAFDIELIYQAEALGIHMSEVSVSCLYCLSFLFLQVAVNWREVEGSKLIQSKFDVITTSLTMARDILAVRLAYVFGFWKLPKF